jgi:hypothetical protein
LIGLFCWAGLLAKVNFVDRKEVGTELSEHFIIIYVVARRMLFPTKQPPT